MCLSTIRRWIYFITTESENDGVKFEGKRSVSSPFFFLHLSISVSSAWGGMGEGKGGVLGLTNRPTRTLSRTSLTIFRPRIFYFIFFIRISNSRLFVITRFFPLKLICICTSLYFWCLHDSHFVYLSYVSPSDASYIILLLPQSSLTFLLSCASFIILFLPHRFLIFFLSCASFIILLPRGSFMVL